MPNHHLVTRFIVADITRKERMEQIFSKYKPNIIFHAAAYKHVPLMEAHPYEAVRVNVFGTKRLADLAVLHQVMKFVMVSTDKAVNPTNVMGASKRLAEMYVQNLKSKEAKTQFITTRFGNVLGSNGSVIPLFRKQIERGGPITITHPEITRYFMTIPEACNLVLEAGAMGNGGEIYIFDMGDSIKIVDLAKNMIELSGLILGKDITIKYTGLRPGEKLYEELLSTKENTRPTHHEKILIADVQKVDSDQLEYILDGLRFALNVGDSNEIVRLMKSMVKEFKSNNSKFSNLD
jgi:FlaA1/EpsC-like NDP-sugar epimerase